MRKRLVPETLDSKLVSSLVFLPRLHCQYIFVLVPLPREKATIGAVAQFARTRERTYE